MKKSSQRILFVKFNDIVSISTQFPDFQLLSELIVSDNNLNGVVF